QTAPRTDLGGPNPVHGLAGGRPIDCAGCGGPGCRGEPSDGEPAACEKRETRSERRSCHDRGVPPAGRFRAECSAPRPAHHPAPASGAALAAGTITEPLARLDRWLAEHRSRYRKGLHAGATSAALDSLQAELGRPLPSELRNLLAWHNGQSADFVGSLEQSWNL